MDKKTVPEKVFFGYILVEKRLKTRLMSPINRSPKAPIEKGWINNRTDFGKIEDLTVLDQALCEELLEPGR